MFPSLPLKQGTIFVSSPAINVKFDRETSQESPRHEITRAIHFIIGWRARQGEGEHSGGNAASFSCLREKFSGGRFGILAETAGNSIVVIDYFEIRAQSYFRPVIDRSKSITRCPPPRERPIRGVEQPGGSMEMTVPLKIQR